jgi:hypothetical protein
MHVTRWHCKKKKGREVYLSIGQPQSLVNKWIENSCVKVTYVSWSCHIGVGFFYYFCTCCFRTYTHANCAVKFSTLRFRSYWCCVGKARSTKENQVFLLFLRSLQFVGILILKVLCSNVDVQKQIYLQKNTHTL